MAAHKWQKEIKAWADGAVIRERPRACGYQWYETDSPKFYDNDFIFEISPIQPADADGWRPWFGGENPAPGKMVEVRVKYVGGDSRILTDISADSACWSPPGSAITHWREHKPEPVKIKQWRWQYVYKDEDRCIYATALCSTEADARMWLAKNASHTILGPRLDWTETTE